MGILFFLGIFVGILLEWTWKKWAPLGFCLFQRLTSGPSPPCVSAAPVASSPQAQKEHLDITDGDLHHLQKLDEKNDGGPLWKHLMDHKTPNMICQAWQRDSATGPPQYYTRTVYEDATPEMVRDFFWDDESRLQWDDMLLNATTIDECSATGAMAVHWVRKFPFFCSDREYIIGRRIWESAGTYYCVTKGVPYPSIPPKKAPKRVDLYYSSWVIRAVASTRGNGEMTACEVVLFHSEDMGIPWRLAKLGVKHGMRTTVQKIEAGLRVYQNQRASGSPLSHTARLAQINTRVDLNSPAPEENNGDSPQQDLVTAAEMAKKKRRLRKLWMIGGVVFLAIIDRGSFPKALVLGAIKWPPKKEKTA
ncbi:uncharacterized protein LOC108226293 [Daucus carota subsp. sativus]|uniref:uncharacterized protein LOC108226293 n=1 Tax=Daucus carota subsp. sativus TaxID=79200 RepID=UPI003082C03E